VLRIVIDANVLVAALTHPTGSAARIVRAWRAGELQVVGSQATLREADAVLSGRWLTRVVGDQRVSELRGDLAERMLVVEPAPLPDMGLRDGGDHRLAEAAVSGGADYLITADRELLALGTRAPTEIVKPSDFVRLLSRAG
jgi:uncharacterized protein